MWKKRGTIRRRRPSVDALEDRYLLSGVDAPSFPPPPAALLQRLLHAVPIGIDAPMAPPARITFQALTDRAAAIGPDAMTGPVATLSSSPLAATVHALASLSDGIAGLPIPLGLPAWIGHAPSSGLDPAPGPIMSPAALAATDHTLAGLSDGIAGGRTPQFGRPWRIEWRRATPTRPMVCLPTTSSWHRLDARWRTAPTRSPDCPLASCSWTGLITSTCPGWVLSRPLHIPRAAGPTPTSSCPPPSSRPRLSIMGTTSTLSPEPGGRRASTLATN